MASDGDIGASLGEMLAYVQEKCPVLRPAIFLRGKVPKYPADLCEDEGQRKLISEKWHQSKGCVVVQTEIDYKNKRLCVCEMRTSSELDAKLGSLDAMLTMLVQGKEEELSVATARFLEVNGHTGEKRGDKHLLQEVVNMSYSIKVLLSNTPTRTVLKANKKEGTAFHTLPLSSEVDVVRALDFITVKDKGKSNKRQAEENSDSDSDSDSDDKADQKRKKRKKRKRGGGKGAA